MNVSGALLGLVAGVGAHLVVTGWGPVVARRYVLRIRSAWEPPPRLRLSATREQGIARRQAAAGLQPDPGAHLLLLVRGAVAGLAVASGLLALLTAAGRVRNPVAAAPLLLLAVLAGGLLADRTLDSAARRRRTRAALELPAVAETMAIAVGAGASLPVACALAAEAEGVLAGEFARLAAEVGDGQPLDRALAAVGERLPVGAVTRFVESLRIALDRGTPLVDVLHAQALDARHEARRELLEQAGRREVLMLLPVVFLVLPSVVVIALYPAFRELASMA